MEVRKKSLFEFFCNTLGKHFFRIPLSEKTIQDLSNKLQFCELEVKPEYVYSSSVATILIGIILAVVISFLGFPTYGLLVAGASVGLAAYLIYYPTLLARYYRIRASSELVSAVLYMIVSLRLVPNLENAVKFAAENLRGPIGRELKRKLWDLSTGKYLKIEDLLDDFAKKWKEENLEFYQAIDMIKTSMGEKGGKRERTLDEAINVLLRGNMERMKDYTIKLKMPLTLITMLGITLPMLTVIMFPIVTIFLSETIKPYMLVVFYNILLPLILYFLMNDVLKTLPVQYGPVDISLHPDAHPIGKYFMSLKGKRIKIPLFPLALLIGSIIIGLGYFVISLSPAKPVTLAKVGGGLIILWGIASMLLFYSYFSYHRNVEIKEEIKEIESEFDDAMFQLAHTLYTGQPIESALEKMSVSTGGLRISKMFERALSNIRRFGFTLRQAFFDEKIGVVKYYPSRMIRSIMRVIVDSIEKGVKGAARTMLSIAEYLKSIHNVEEYGKEILEETTSNMRFMLSVLTPITCGVTVGLATVMVMILAQIVSILSSVTGLTSVAPQLSNPTFLSSIVDVKKIIPAEIFLVIVGSYMLEVIILLSVFLSMLEHGGDPIEEHVLIARGTLTGMIIFSFSILLIYFVFGGMLKMVWSI